MRLLHAAKKTHAEFDEASLVLSAGLVPVMRLAERCGLADLIAEHVQVTERLGVNAPVKVGSIVAGMLAGADSIEDLDVVRHGGMAQGAGFGHTKVQGKSVLVRGLNALAAVISTPQAAPVIAAARLRGGSANSARGAASLAAEAIGAAREAGCSGTLIVRGDSAYYSGAVVAACRRADARFSLTVTVDPKVKAAIAAIGADTWHPIRYPNAIWDEDGQCWISDAEVAEIGYTAFAGNARHRTTARLIVRRVKDLAVQDELFPVWRYHAVFTDNPHELIQAETQHRSHAIIEQVFADLFDGPLAHLPSGRFAANAAWLTCAAIAHNLLRAAGALASTFHAKARGATLRHHLVAAPARLARHGRGHITLHLPDHWPWQTAWENLFTATHRAPPPAA